MKKLRIPHDSKGGKRDWPKNTSADYSYLLLRRKDTTKNLLGDVTKKLYERSKSLGK